MIVKKLLNFQNSVFKNKLSGTNLCFSTINSFYLKLKIMKKTTILLSVCALLLCLGVAKSSHATIWTVTVSNFTFSPDNLPDVKIGDVVRFEWASGSHTTTSTSVPGGAETWDSPINIEFPDFEYTPTVTGTYEYVCTPHASMGMDGTFTVSTAVGIDEEEAEPEISLSPNPFRNEVSIGFSDNANLKVNQISIYDISGKLVYVAESNQGEAIETMKINLADLLTGFYFVRISDQNDKTYTRKVLKD
jgi:plastocyanin